MKTNITFISASAGSGKTHRITEVIEDRLAKGLCRPGGLIATTYTVKAAATVAEKLTQRGYAVTLSQSGLLATPEARLALACLRRLADPTDSLASAEIVALGATRQPEEWLESRLKYVRD